MEPKQPTGEAIALARLLFDTYNETGPNPWLTFDGRAVPVWSDLSDQVRAKWTAAAEKAIELARAGLLSGTSYTGMPDARAEARALTEDDRVGRVEVEYAPQVDRGAEHLRAGEYVDLTIADLPASTPESEQSRLLTIAGRTIGLGGTDGSVIARQFAEFINSTAEDQDIGWPFPIRAEAEGERLRIYGVRADQVWLSAQPSLE